MENPFTTEAQRHGEERNTVKSKSKTQARAKRGGAEENTKGFEFRVSSFGSRVSKANQSDQRWLVCEGKLQQFTLET
jgi:hypothetical protein